MILLTGGTGFLGQHLVRTLLNADYDLRLLVRNPQQRQFPWQNMVEIVEGDILDPVSLERAMDGVTQVIHAAAFVSFWRKERDKVMHVNAVGTERVVNACLEMGIEKLVHVSSTAATGKSSRNPQEMITEETTWNPALATSVYSRSKYRAEMEIYRGITEGLTASIVNPGIILGPTNNWEEGTGKIFSIVNRGLRFYNPGASGFVGVEDVARACQLVLEKEDANGQRYILVGENLPFRQIFAWVAEAIGKKAPQRALAPSLSRLVGRISELLSRISGKPPIVSLESMRNGVKTHRFDGQKIETLGLAYTPIKAVIQEAAQQFLADQQTKS